MKQKLLKKYNVVFLSLVLIVSCFTLVSIPESEQYLPIIPFISEPGIDFSSETDVELEIPIIEEPKIPTGPNVDQWIETQVDIPTGTSFRLFTQWGGWWSDAEKTPLDDGIYNAPPDNVGDEDDLLCWAATAANMLEWTGWGFANNDLKNKDTDDFLDYYEDHVVDVGHYVDYGLDWWFSGTIHDNASIEDVDHTGFYPTYTGLGDNVWNDGDDTKALQNIRSQLLASRAVGLSIYPPNPPGGHAITCWGFNYNVSIDPSTNPVDYFLGIWVTDSDSDKGVNNADDRLSYFEVDYDDTNNRWFMPNYGAGWWIGAVSSLKMFPGIHRPIADMLTPIGNEGTPIWFDAGPTIDTDSVDLEYRWDFDGDGIWDTAWGSSNKLIQRTFDDDYIGEVYLEVFDGRLRDIKVETLVVQNVAPDIILTGDTIDESEIATIHTSINDLGDDSFNALWDFGDGETEIILYPKGTQHFEKTHLYEQDGEYLVTLTVTDDDGGSNTASTWVEVLNTAPFFTSCIGSEIDENGFATVSGVAQDNGLEDVLNYWINWGDGTSEIYYHDSNYHEFEFTHQYLDDNPTGTPQDLYSVYIMVSDEDDASDSWTTTVTVDNVPPMITNIEISEQPNPDLILPIIHELAFEGLFVDVGTEDTHAAFWDWDDGNTTSGIITYGSLGTGTITGNHTYNIPGNYSVILTITDDDGGTHSATLLVVVESPEQAVNSLNEDIQDLPDEVFLKGSEIYRRKFDQRLDSIYKEIVNERFNSAIKQLESLGKNALSWIADPEIREKVVNQINDIIEYLLLL